MDAYTSIVITINTSKVHKVPLEVWEPIGKGLSILLIGRPSATMQGVFVHLGVIDTDFNGQIHAMLSTSTPPMTIPEKNTIAQLIFF